MGQHSYNRIKVLVVDDSAIVRKLLSEAISSDPGMEVVGTAPDPYVARDKILALKPDVLTLDIEMPRMDGITFLKRLMKHHPVPTIVISSLGQASCGLALEALRCGAVEVLAKPSGPYSVGELRHNLCAKVRAAAASRPRAMVKSERTGGRVVAAGTSYDPRTILAVGASTGGTVAIQELLQGMPAGMPGMVITQHIPKEFSASFANRLNAICAMEVKEAAAGDVVREGLVLLAPGDEHLLVRRSDGRYVVELMDGPKVCYQRPSVDVMFASVAEAAGNYAVAALLTGMGSDGAKGMLTLREAGATTIAQDEASCVVFGMPREAIRLGGAGVVAPLAEIAETMLRATMTGRGTEGNNLEVSAVAYR